MNALLPRLLSPHQFTRLIPLLLMGLLLLPETMLSQNRTTFSIALDPSITWFSSDRNTIDTKGSRASLSYGLVLDHFFGEKYALSTGIGISSLGGILSYPDTVLIKISYDTVSIPAGTSIRQRINYLTIPLGLKLKTVEIGYQTFFVDLGLRGLIRIRSKASTEDELLKNDQNNDEINLFNMAYYIGAGLEYSLGGNTAIITGIYYSRSFLDITTDGYGKPTDKMNSNALTLRLGVLF